MKTNYAGSSGASAFLVWERDVGKRNRQRIARQPRARHPRNRHLRW